MKTISEFLYTKSSLPLCMALTVFMGLYAWLVMGSQSECMAVEMPEGSKLLGLEFGYTPDMVMHLLGSMSDRALLCYSKLLLIWDSLFPFVYGSMYFFWISLIYKHHPFKNQTISLINLFPALPLLIDLLENYLENGLVTDYLLFQEISSQSIRLASFITQVKWFFSGLNYTIILIGIILLMRRKWLAYRV